MGLKRMRKYLRKIKKDLEGKEVNPMEWKKRLGSEIVKLYHSQKDAEKAQAEFEKVFSKKELPENIPVKELSYSEKQVWTPYVCTASGIATSTSQAVRLIEQGGLYIDNERVTDVNKKIEVDGKEHLFKAGKRTFYKIILKYNP